MDPYLLPRNASESSRLDIQHSGVTAVLGHFAHPSLGNLSQFQHILDNGTGTTIWATSALSGGCAGITTRLRDDVVIEGADISDEQFPPQNQRHPKLGELFVHDVLAPFPFRKRARYDLVHQRFLILALRKDQWPLALTNLHGAIKPGGYLSLTEINVGVHQQGKSRAELPRCLRILNQMQLSFCERTNKNINLAHDLVDLVRAAGFVDVKSTPALKWWMGGGPHTRHFDAQFPADTARNALEFFKAMAVGSLSLGGVDGLRTQVEAIQVLQEFEVLIQKDAIWESLVSVVGRKS